MPDLYGDRIRWDAQSQHMTCTECGALIALGVDASRLHNEWHARLAATQEPQP